jgi:signal transduction histidine kinase
MGVLAHEFRNPLASLHGCALTLLDRDEQLPGDIRRGLTQVIVTQSQRLGWLILAVSAMGEALGRRIEDTVDITSVVAEAGAQAEVSIVSGKSRLQFTADRTRVRLGVEALLLALMNGGSEVTARLSDEGDVLDVVTSAGDLDRGGRSWKLDLARRLLRREGCELRIRRTPSGARAKVRFPIPAGTTSRRIA